MLMSMWQPRSIANGGVLWIESFPTNEAGYESVAGWLAGFGPVEPGWGGGRGILRGWSGPVPHNHRY